MTTIQFERVRGFQPPWRTVAVYTCDSGHETRVCVSHHGPPPHGAIRCASTGCDVLLRLDWLPYVRGR